MIGLHYDLDERAYRGQHDWLSASGIKKILPPFAPAKFKAQQDGDEEFSDTFDFGKAAHHLVLGVGADIAVAPYENWATKAAREFKADAREAGQSPILAADYAKAMAMAKAVAEHPVASALFSGGEPEVSAFWVDPATDVPCRARFDYLPEKVEGRRLIVPDYKTAASAHPEKFAKAVADYGYHIQQEHYSDALRALGIDEDPAFLFVVQEKEEPYLINVIPLDEDAARLGRALADKGRRLYRECTRTGRWPGYTPSDEIAEPVSLPGYYAFKAEEYVS